MRIGMRSLQIWFCYQNTGEKKNFWTATPRGGKVSGESSFQSHCQIEKQRVRTSLLPKRMVKEVWPTCNKMKTSTAKIVGLAAMLPSQRLTYFQKIHVKLKLSEQSDPSHITKFSLLPTEDQKMGCFISPVGLPTSVVLEQ